MYDTCIEKQSQLKMIFDGLNREEQYQKIIALGRVLEPFTADDEYLVPGCQSRMYLLSSFEEGLMRYRAYSDALISAGLAALLLAIYDGETPETILKCPATVLEELDIPSLLSPGRANGLNSLYTRMKQDALASFTL